MAKQIVKDTLEPRQILLREGDILIAEGTTTKDIFWLKDGKLEVWKRKGAGEILLGGISSGEIVGEMSIFDEGPRSATVKAKTACTLLQIPKAKYAEIYKRQPPWFQGMVRSLVQRVRKTTSKVRE